MNLVEYDRKIEMLSDEKTYQLLKRDLALSLERQLNSRLLDLKKKYHHSCTNDYATLILYLYSLPKVHELGVPLRLIVPFVPYQLSKYLARILSPLIGNSESNVQNSAEFATFIRSKSLKGN